MVHTPDAEIKHKIRLKRVLKFYKVNEEGNVLFNDELNTFYVRLYGVSTRKEGNVFKYRIRQIKTTEINKKSYSLGTFLYVFSILSKPKY